MTDNKLRVGVIGAGDVAQVVHLPTLTLLSHLYTIVAICDVSLKTVRHCATKFSIPTYTTDPSDLFTNTKIDVIFILTSDEFHAVYTIEALKAGKHVMLEKPFTLSVQSGQAIVDAERDAPNGARVFVGYMRRYAPSLVGAFKREIASIPRIMYARVRDIIGPNSYFIEQSGCFPEKYFDDVATDAQRERQQLLEQLIGEAWGKSYADLSKEQIDYCRLLGGLGSHGLGVMREALGGLPEEVIASTHNANWFTTMFNYHNKTLTGDHFTCLFEMAIDSVPRFDSHVIVYGEHKTVSIVYDTPFVKGLGITVEIDEMNEHGEKVHRSVQTSYEDPYTAELRELHACLTEGKPIKTSAIDAMEDLKLYKMMLEKYPERSEEDAKNIRKSERNVE